MLHKPCAKSKNSAKRKFGYPNILLRKQVGHFVDDYPLQAQ